MATMIDSPLFGDLFGTEEMRKIFSDETTIQKWLDVEIAVCEVHADMGTIPRDAVDKIKRTASFSVDRINEIERTTRHDVIAFTTAVSERMAKWMATGESDELFERFTLARFAEGRLEREDMIIG